MNIRKSAIRRASTIRKRTVGGAALAICMTITAAGLGSATAGASHAKKSGSTINIGALIPETGAFSVYAPSIKEGIGFALKQAHDKIGSHKIVLHKLNDNTKLTTALAAARQLVDSDHVVGILGPLNSGIMSGLEPFLAQSKTPAIAWESTPATVGKSGWVVTPGGNLAQIAYSTGEYASSVMKLKTADMITDNYEAGWEIGAGFDMGFKSGGGKIAQAQWDTLATTNFQPYVAAVSTAPALAVWNPATEATLIKTYESVKPVAGQQLFIDYADVPFQSQITNTKLGPLFAGTYSDTSYAYTLKTHKNKKFVKHFKKQYHSNPTLSAETAYEDAHLLIKALKKTHGSTNTTAIKNALHHITFTGPAGKIHMQPSGFPTRTYYVVKLESVHGTYTWVPVHKYKNLAPILHPVTHSTI